MHQARLHPCRFISRASARLYITASCTRSLQQISRLHSIRKAPATSRATDMAKIHTPIPSLKLNDGNSIPMLAYGTGTAWYKTGDENQIDKTLIASIKKAIELEYYHLDGAEVYKTEQELGTAIKESKVPRDKLFVTTKVNNGVKDIPAALKTSLKKLQLDCVDLYLIHQPWLLNGDEELQSAWKSMEDLQKAGLAKSIGVSNYMPEHLAALMKTAKVTPAINQIEFNPYLQHNDLLAIHKQHGIATAAYGPLTPVTKATPGPLDSMLEALAKKYGVSANEILIRWCIEQDIVPITTSGKEQRLSDYLRVATFKLTPKEVEDIKTIGEKKHFRGFWAGKYAADDRT